MKTLKNNAGMTLVEIVLSIMILAIGAFMLAEGFSASARINNRATNLKNSSLAASSTLEVEEVVESNDPAVDVSYETKDGGEITISYKDADGSNKTLKQSGEYAEAEDSGTGLKYKEFYPNNFSFDVPATPVG